MQRSAYAHRGRGRQRAAHRERRAEDRRAEELLRYYSAGKRARLYEAGSRKSVIMAEKRDGEIVRWPSEEIA